MSIKVSEIFEKKYYHKVELLAFIYGSLIVRLSKDIEDVNEINKQIELMGYDIGKRLIDDVVDDYNKNSNYQKDILINQILFDLCKKFFGIATSEFKQITEKEFQFSFPENPLNLFVDLPEKLNDLWYSNILCGIFRGALEAVNISVECAYVKDKLRGDATNEIKITLLEYIEEKFVDDEE